jgi:DNA invertase Pin-like site-specific DNA recombinase
MARKTRQEIEQERINEQRYALGNVILNVEKLLLIYARQSSSKQYVSNIYSAMEQRDGLLEKASTLGWTRDEQWILYVENNLAKKTQVSGSLRIDQRPGLQALTDVIESGKASAVLVVSVDRITRDEDMITPVQFANLCKRYGVVIITDDYIYDFNNPNRDDMGRFMNEAIASKEYVRKQIKGKMLKNRTRKANMGLVANGIAPIGLMLDESRDNLVPSPHADRVDWLYARFRAFDANLGALLREVIEMAKRGEPLFPDVEGWTPERIFSKRVTGGWTVSTRFGLKYILTNPMYVGHLVFNGRIVKYNAHPAIVEADNWQYAFDHLADIDLEGNEIDRQDRAVRYTQKTSIDSGALLAGTRDNGKLVIDGVNGAHVYIHLTTKSYQIKQWKGLTVSGYETAFNIKRLDKILEARLLHWLQVSDRMGESWMSISETVKGDWLISEVVKGEQSPSKTMGNIEKNAQPKNTVQSDLELTNQELAQVQRALQFQDSMSDERLEATLKKEARLIKRRAELEQVQAKSERIAKQREQAKDDIESAASKWSGWTLEKRRSFIRMITESITLEEIAGGWLRLTLVWSPLMGFISPTTTTQQAVDVAYIWRQSGNQWAEDELTLLREHYPTMGRAELLHVFPGRSWQAIVSKAINEHITKTVIKRNDGLAVPTNTSLTDLHVLNEFMLEPNKRVQWHHYHQDRQTTNDDDQSCSA